MMLSCKGFILLNSSINSLRIRPVKSYVVVDRTYSTVIRFTCILDNVLTCIHFISCLFISCQLVSFISFYHHHFVCLEIIVYFISASTPAIFMASETISVWISGRYSSLESRLVLFLTNARSNLNIGKLTSSYNTIEPVHVISNNVVF